MLTTQSERCLITWRNGLKASGDWSGWPVSGLRAWRCTIAAPASAAPIAASAISSGVTGRWATSRAYGSRPVTAQVMMTLPLTWPCPSFLIRRCPWPRAAYARPAPSAAGRARAWRFTRSVCGELRPPVALDVLEHRAAPVDPALHLAPQILVEPLVALDIVAHAAPAR